MKERSEKAKFKDTLNSAAAVRSSAFAKPSTVAWPMADRTDDRMADMDGTQPRGTTRWRSRLQGAAGAETGPPQKDAGPRAHV